MLTQNVPSLILNDRKHLHFKKDTYPLNNYREYNQALKRRDKFDIRLSEEIINIGNMMNVFMVILG
ncbi:hypothetical protein C9J48_06630 [Photobacterium profundum]|uniref:Hypothetical transposase n=1 Tax=Photobacterium profundum 3TCK TaxID=314280 RepID=Q1Z9Y5_9GAMM|nr:Hypothetical transposase [Photobacterium profundum 3TCK]PSV63146.1 hypothetical protein C9J48_06630 [Photobacterium profundum]